jgi:hypothetical protein
MLGRRELLGTVGVAAVAVGAFRTLGKVGVGAHPEHLLAGAGVGPRARFGTCQVVHVERTPDGAVAVQLADGAGQRFELELLGHDPRAPGVARAGSLGVYMNNRGEGTTPTIEEHGLAAMHLAHHLARREASGAMLPVLPALLERLTSAGSAPT